VRESGNWPLGVSSSGDFETTNKISFEYNMGGKLDSVIGNKKF